MLALTVCTTAYLVGNAAPCAASRSCQDVKMSADVPSIVVGGGRIGSLLASLGESVIVRRGDPIVGPESPTTGPIYVTTRNEEARHESRHFYYVFLFLMLFLHTRSS